MLKYRFMGIAVMAAAVTFGATAQGAEDEREMVPFPDMMRQHMLSNMRGHLRTLEAINEALADGQADKAAEIAEANLGMSSLELHGAAQIAKFMPPPMQTMGTELHHASSRFVIAVQNADTEQTFKSQQEIFAALGEVMAACNACHSAYRVH